MSANGKGPIRAEANGGLHFFPKPCVRLLDDQLDVGIRPIIGLDDTEDFGGRILAHAVPLTEIQIRNHSHARLPSLVPSCT